MYDLVVVGGGINGVGIAADAAGRGLSVALFEQNDLASATSSASSKLIHGGLRYLEQYEFRLVREALREREVLMTMAPHLISPMRFRLPHESHLRPAWMIRAGLFLYDHLADRSFLPGCKTFRFGKKSVLKPEFKLGFEYSDCWVDDARLVVLNARMASEKGADILTHHRVEHAHREHSHWVLRVASEQGTIDVKAHALVNAAGPWVQRFLEDKMQRSSPYSTRLVQGSHIIVPRLHDETESYILQNSDGRIVFVIPYLDEFSMIGTTDQEFEGDPSQAKITDEEVKYLCDVCNQHFQNQISVADVLHTFSGVRPLMQDESSNPAKVTRDYTLHLSEPDEGAALLSIFGGKLTTYRKLSEAVMEKLKPVFPQMGEAWTQKALLPGGDFPMSMTEYIEQLKKRRPGLPEKLLVRWAAHYGSYTEHMLQGRTQLDELGTRFSEELYQIEVDYLMENEWARSVQDILWRRTKLGYKLTESEVNELSIYLDKVRFSDEIPLPSQVNGHNG